jgi:hypothetical protein
MTLTEELFNLIHALDEAGIEYAVCGGLAMALHGYPRSTMDIDLLIREDDLEPAKQISRSRGFMLDAGLMKFNEGEIHLYRMTKIRDENHEAIPLDLLLVSGDDMRGIWQTRERWETESGAFWVVGAKGLIQMKKKRNSGQDQDDIRRLEAIENEG